VTSRLQPVVTGVVTAVVGFSGSFAIVLAGLTAVGASDAEAASGLLTVVVASGLLSIVVSLVFRTPVGFAWSLPGSALLVTTAGVTGRFSDAVAAFIVAGLLVVVVGLWPALGRLVASIPKPLANAMLAGILFPLCISPVTATLAMPVLALPVILLWLVLYRLAPRWAVPAAMTLAIVLLVATTNMDRIGFAPPAFVAVLPTFDPLVVVSIALPLFIVTMAGQNISGAAILSSFDYTVPWRTSLISSGALSAVGALTGGLTVNLAAITQALTAGDEASPDRSKRWIAAASMGVCYVVIALFAGTITTLARASSPLLIEAVAGLALIAAFIGAIAGAVEDTDLRVPAIVTFLVTASGIAFVGIGSAFWGLAIGGLVALWLTWRNGRQSPH
jgi:benzoate membrane transport protein